MDLFGAATKGVDPQTGSYLSKEQRIAMFRASRGQGGSGGGVPTGGGGGGPRVAPQNSIVVVNKLNQLSKALSTNFATGAATDNIADQVAKNTKDIASLYKLIEAKQAEDLKDQKDKSKKLRLDAGRRAARMREGLIEGISGAAAAAANTAKSIGDSVSKPVVGFLERIVKALTYLGAAWFIRNLPTITAKIEGMFDDLEGTKESLAKFLLNQRGWAAGVETFLKSVYKGLKGIGGTIKRITTWIGSKLIGLVQKIFSKVSSVISRAFDYIINKTSKLWNVFTERFKNLLSEPVRKALSALKKNPVTQALSGAAKNTFNFAGNVFNKLKSFGGTVSKNVKSVGNKVFTGFKAGAEGLKNAATNVFGKPIKAFAEKSGVKRLSDAARSAGLKKIFSPIIKALGIPFNIASKILKNAARIPVVGVLVDVALNKAGGMDWVNSIINGLATGISGAVGWKAGGVAGAAVGSAIFPGPGTAIGGILGAIGGSMLAANLAEGGVNAIRKGLGGEEVERPQVTQSTLNVVGSIPGAEFLKDSSGTMPSADFVDVPKISANLTGRFEDISSTPIGMYMPEGSSTVNYDFIEMPPITKKLSLNKQSAGPDKVEGPPALSSTDDQMSPYRALALQQYQLAQ